MLWCNNLVEQLIFIQLSTKSFHSEMGSKTLHCFTAYNESNLGKYFYELKPILIFWLWTDLDNEMH